MATLPSSSESSTVESQKPSSTTCPQHNNQTPVCVGSTVDEPSKDNGYKVQKIDDATAQKKSEIADNVEGLQEKKRQLEQVTKRINETKMKLEDRKNQVNGMIHEVLVKLHQFIDQRGAELLAVNTQIASAKESRLSTQQKGIQQLMESITHCLSVSSISTSEYSNEQLQAIANTPLEPCDTPLIATDFNTEELKKLITQFTVVADPSPNGPNCSAIVPRQRLALRAIMKVKVITRNGQGEALTVGRATVRGRLSYNGGIVNDSLGITDNGDGTYLIDVTTDQQLGQHQLSITVNGWDIQGSPFSLDIVPPKRDYTKLNQPVQEITGIIQPTFIAFAHNGDMFVSSYRDHRIHVYDASGNKKTTIGSGQGSGELQFQSPFGMDINGDVVYVAEFEGHRIHKLTTGGEFLGTFGEKGSAVGQFNGPCDVKISPDGKVYVPDRHNHRVQVFNPDWSVSHVIDGTVLGEGHFKDPNGIAFDILGNVHVIAYKSCSVTVFTSVGQFVRQYGDKSNISGPGGIATDPAGYCLITSYLKATLYIFDSNGTLVHSLGGFNHPIGVSISPAVNGSVWVADNGNNRLMEY